MQKEAIERETAHHKAREGQRRRRQEDFMFRFFESKKKREWKRVKNLIEGKKELDQMKKEIDDFMTIISFFLRNTSPSTFTPHEEKRFFHVDDVVWGLFLSFKERPESLEDGIEKMAVVKISCFKHRMSSSIEDAEEAYEVYEYNILKNVPIREPKAYNIREIHASLPGLEKELHKKFEWRWRNVLQPFAKL